jgi:hypothetical protein
MKADQNAKYVKDVAAEAGMVSVRKPFRIEAEDKRRFIRLVISSPMSMKKIRDTAGNYWPEGDWHVIHGMILNISAGGVLVELDQAVEEGDVVSMQFTIQEVEGLDNVLGLTKRVDIDPEGCLAGIEFITREQLSDHFSQGEMELLSETYTNFDDSVRQVLNRYAYTATGKPETE